MLSVLANAYSTLGRSRASTRVKCHWGTYWGSVADVFLKYNPVWGRGRTVQVVKRVQGRGVTHKHPDVSKVSQRHHIKICHRSWDPSTPTIDIHKKSIVFLFSHPFDMWVKQAKQTNKTPINNTNKVARHEESNTKSIVILLDGSWWESSAPVAERPEMCSLHWQQAFPRVTAAVLTFPLHKWTRVKPVKRCISSWLGMVNRNEREKKNLHGFPKSSWSFQTALLITRTS